MTEIESTSDAFVQINPQDKKRKLDKIVLRIDNAHGHHIIRYSDKTQSYSIEGYSSKPENYRTPPQYFFPITKQEVKVEFEKQEKEWRYG